MENNEKTVYLIDYSGSTTDDMFLDMSKYISRRFRPGDCVVGWHHMSFAVSFLGNPTYEDIINVRKTQVGGTDLRQAILYARKMSPGGKLFVLSDGYHENLNEEFDYDFVIFTAAGTKEDHKLNIDRHPEALYYPTLEDIVIR